MESPKNHKYVRPHANHTQPGLRAGFFARHHVRGDATLTTLPCWIQIGGSAVTCKYECFVAAARTQHTPPALSLAQQDLRWVQRFRAKVVRTLGTRVEVNFLHSSRSYAVLCRRTRKSAPTSGRIDGEPPLHPNLITQRGYCTPSACDVVDIFRRTGRDAP